MNNIAVIGTGAYGLSIAIALLKKCKKELLAKSLNHRYSGHSEEKEAKLYRPWTRAVFQYPQKSSSAQGWQVKGGCHSVGWQPTWERRTS